MAAAAGSYNTGGAPAACRPWRRYGTQCIGVRGGDRRCLRPGEATARALAAHGVRVALFDLNAEKGEAVARELGGVFCRVDVTSEEQVEAGFAKARAAIGRAHLVNCAGTGNAFKTASRAKEAPDQIKFFPRTPSSASSRST